MAFSSTRRRTPLSTVRTSFYFRSGLGLAHFSVVSLALRGFLSDGQPAILAKHTPEAIKVTQYFANFFIQQAPTTLR